MFRTLWFGSERETLLSRPDLNLHEQVSKAFTVPPYAIQLTRGEDFDIVVNSEETSFLATAFLNILTTGKNLNTEEAKKVAPYDSDYNMALHHGIQDYHIAASYPSTYAQVHLHLAHFPAVLCGLVTNYTGYIAPQKWYPGDLRLLTTHNPSDEKSHDEMTHCVKVIFSKPIVMDPSYPQMLPFILEDLYAIQKLRNNLLAVIENKDYKLCDKPLDELKKIVGEHSAIFPSVPLTRETNPLAVTSLDSAGVARVLRNVVENQFKLQLEDLVTKIDLQIKECGKFKLFNRDHAKEQIKQLQALRKALGGLLLTTIPNYLTRAENIARMPNFFRPSVPPMIMADAAPDQTPQPSTSLTKSH